MFGNLRKLVEEKLGRQQKPAQVRPALPMQRMAQPINQPAQGPRMTPSQRDFPGRTNYGVPEDDMIDTPNGYITGPQYDAQQIEAYNATQPYTMDNVRNNRLVDAGQSPEWRREGRLRVMANRGLQTDQEDPQNRIFWN